MDIEIDVITNLNLGIHIRIDSSTKHASEAKFLDYALTICWKIETLTYKLLTYDLALNNLQGLTCH